jgi:hypothetical protein
MFKKNSKIKKCGFDKKPCIQDECMHYVSMNRSWKDDKGQVHEEKYNDCAINALVKQNCDVIGSNHNVQKAIESFRNETVKSHNNILNVTNAMRQIGIDDGKGI